MKKILLIISLCLIVLALFYLQIKPAQINYETELYLEDIADQLQTIQWDIEETKELLEKLSEEMKWELEEIQGDLFSIKDTVERNEIELINIQLQLIRD